MIDFIIRLVPGHGYLPIITKDGKEFYRGEFKKTTTYALTACEVMLAAMIERGEI